MKPTNKQNEVIETSKRIINYWLSTNDLNSPSHISIITDEIYSIDGLSTEEQFLVIHNLIDLLKTIKHLSV